jgi:hypothetical protein
MLLMFSYVVFYSCVNLLVIIYILTIVHIAYFSYGALASVPISLSHPLLFMRFLRMYH